MRKSAIAIIIIVLAIIVLGVLIYDNSYPSNITTIDQECSNQDGYCIYNGIPGYMQYSEPSFFRENEEGETIILDPESFNEIGSIEKFEGDISNYIVRDDSDKGIGEAFGGGWDKYECIDTGNPPVVVEYFYDLCEGFGGEGCWHERKAIACGDFYFVQDFTSSYGPRMYGPFGIPPIDS